MTTCKKEYAAAYRAAHRAEARAYQAKYRAANKEKVAERETEYKQRTKDKQAAYQAEYRKAHKEGIALQRKKWREGNCEKAAERERMYRQRRATEIKLYMKSIPDKRAAYFAKYVAAKNKRIPPWANLSAIERVYETARKCGMHVDHVVPLQGKLVSGLHVEYNLQLLSRIENSKKRNRFDPETHVHRIE